MVFNEPALTTYVILPKIESALITIRSGLRNWWRWRRRRKNILKKLREVKKFS